MRKSKRIFALMLAVLLSLTLLAACQEQVVNNSSGGQTSSDPGSSPESQEATGPIKVAVLGPMTGNYAHHGMAYRVGVQLAFDEYNANGGYNGTEVEVLIYDDQNDAAEGVSCAQQMVTEEGMLICLGPWSSTVAFAVEPITSKADIPLIAMSSSHADMTKISEYTLRGGNMQEKNLSVRVDVCERMGLMNAAVVYDMNNESFTAGAEIFERLFTEIGGKVSIMSGMPANSMDFASIIAQYQSLGIDCIHTLFSYTEMSAFTKQVRDREIDVPIFYDTAVNIPEFRELVAGYTDMYMMISFHQSLPFVSVQEFVTKFKEASDGTEPSNHAYYAYVSALLTIDGLEAIGPGDGAALAAYMRDKKGLETPMGPLDYYGGDPDYRLFVMEFDGTDFVWSDEFNDPELFAELERIDE